MRLTLIAAVGLLAACSSDPNGPRTGLLTGLYGNPEQHAQLVALHRSAELQFPCGSYFESREPIVLDGDLTFRAPGKLHLASFGIPADPTDVVAVGSYESATGLVRMHLEGDGDDPIPYVLTPGQSGELDQVVCALTSAI